MPNLIDNHTGIPFQTITIQEALTQIRQDIDNAIISNGETGKNALIRSQRPIKLIHNAVKSEFLNSGRIHPSLINPSLNVLNQAATQSFNSNFPITLTDRELSLAGYLKTKKQDVSIVPNNIPVMPETLTFPTYLNNYLDRFGKDFTESVISVNIRSQLSSVAKNFDTLYERTFAESLNFHLRLPRMVLGEVYLIIAKEYDSKAAAQNTISFKDSRYIEKYILAFEALNNRSDITDPPYKYERVALLIVDFSQNPPKLYNTTQELIIDGIITPNSIAQIENLSFVSFVRDILQVYHTRFPDNTFT